MLCCYKLRSFSKLFSAEGLDVVRARRRVSTLITIRTIITEMNKMIYFKD